MSNSSSNATTPRGSNSDLTDESLYTTTEPSKVGTRMKNVEDAEGIIQRAIQETADLRSEYVSLRTQSQGHSRRINELQHMFDGVRTRVDFLASSRSTHTQSFLSVSPRETYSYDTVTPPAMEEKVDAINLNTNVEDAEA